MQVSVEVGGHATMLRGANMEKYPVGSHVPAEVPDEPGSVITRVRVTQKRAAGVHVRFETSDGQQRQAWVPTAIIDDAKRRLAEHHNLVAATDGGEPLGAAATDLLAILCAQSGPGFDDALYEASWVGPSPLGQPEYVYGTVQPQVPHPTPEADARQQATWAADEESSAIHPHLGRGAVVTPAYEPQPALAEPEAVEPLTLALMALAGAASAAITVLAAYVYLWPPVL